MLRKAERNITLLLTRTMATMHTKHTSVENLIAKSRREMALKHMALKTEKSYIGWAKRYAYWLIKNPKGTTEEKINGFLSYLANEKNVAVNTQSQALNAIVWIYKNVLNMSVGDIGLFTRARKARRLPTVLSQTQAIELIRNLTGVHWLIGSILYGSGLRLNECLSLRVQDIDFDRHQIMIRNGKGSKDRVVMLPAPLINPIKEKIEAARRIHRRDLIDGFGEVYLPHALERKIGMACKEFKWQYIFQSTKISVDPRSGVLRRHHLHDSAVSKALRAAAKFAAIDKRVTAHTLRHSFATHLIERGVNITTVQELMGHTDIRTTQIYIHVAQNAATSITSPLEQPNITYLSKTG